MSYIFRAKSWSPYIVGACIGLLSWFSFATANKPLGITTTFENMAARFEAAVLPGFSESDYYAAKFTGGKGPKLDWQWMLVLGVFIGAFASSWLSSDRTNESVPRMWRERFGPSPMRRLIAAFIAGGLMMFGARLAGGCTSGHGISGAMQFAVSSWVFLVTFFPVATAVAFLMYGKSRKSHV